MIHIAFTIDHKFTRYCAVTMVSILKNNAPKEITFHIVAQNLPQEDCRILSQLINGYGAFIEFYNVPNEKIQNYKVQWEGQRLSIVVFYRCLLASILPSTISQVLYLDSDILVLDSLKELWNSNLNKVALAGIQDTVSPNPNFSTRLQYDISYNYFNGGVLLLNLDYWRQHNIEMQCQEYYQQYKSRIIYNDQDILNGLLYNQKILVDMKWNVQDDFYRISSYHSSEWKPSYTQAILSPIILHYCGRKPWAYHCMHPLRHLFFDYQKLTPYDDWIITNKASVRIHKFIHFLPYTLGIKKKKYIDINKLRRNQQGRQG